MSGFAHLLNAVAGIIRFTAENRQKKERNAVVHFNRASAKARRGDHDGAIVDCGRAIAIDPDYAGAWHFRGLIKSVLGDLDGAIADYDQAIALNPNNADYYSSRGRCKTTRRDHDEAIADFDSAIYINPYNADAYAGPRQSGNGQKQPCQGNRRLRPSNCPEPTRFRGLLLPRHHEALES